MPNLALTLDLFRGTTSKARALLITNHAIESLELKNLSLFSVGLHV